MATHSEPPSEESFEVNFQRLESIVSDLESGDLTLDQSMLRYEEGMQRLRVCFARLKSAEAKIEELIEESGGESRTVPFDLKPPEGGDS